MLLFALILWFVRLLPERLTFNDEEADISAVPKSDGEGQGAPGWTVYAKALAS